jgi:hypothetical protein
MRFIISHALKCFLYARIVKTEKDKNPYNPARKNRTEQSGKTKKTATRPEPKTNSGPDLKQKAENRDSSRKIQTNLNRGRTTSGFPCLVYAMIFKCGEAVSKFINMPSQSLP